MGLFGRRGIAGAQMDDRICGGDDLTGVLEMAAGEEGKDRGN